MEKLARILVANGIECLLSSTPSLLHHRRQYVHRLSTYPELSTLTDSVDRSLLAPFRKLEPDCLQQRGLTLPMLEGLPLAADRQNVPEDVRTSGKTNGLVSSVKQRGICKLARDLKDLLNLNSCSQP